MQYEIVAEAYRDLERVSGRLALIDRLAALLARTPSELLGTVCYLCQGLIAPEFAGVDLGLAEKLALRAVATATGADVLYTDVWVSMGKEEEAQFRLAQLAGYQINAGLLAVGILATTRPDLRERLRAFRAEQTAKVRRDALP